MAAPGAGVKLTEGSVMVICKGESTDEKYQPVVQVVDLKAVNTQAHHSSTERFRLLLSDGTHYQQGMLGTQLNGLVKSGKLQKGSVVQLREYVCNPIQDRLIIIVIEMDLIVEKCDIIGEPVSAPRLMTGSASGNPQSFGGASSIGGPVNKPNVSGAAAEQSRMNQSFVSSNNSDPGRFAASNAPPLYTKTEPVSSTRFQGSGPLSGPSSDQKMGAPNPRPLMNTYAHPSQSPYNQPPPVYANIGPISKNEAPPRIIPISALNPYQGRWTIKARVTVKGELRHYNNPRGDGKVFSFDLLDSDGGEIRATCFNAVADQFYNQIENSKVYLISKGSLKPAQKNFNHLNNDLEIFLENTSTIQPCFEDENSISRQQFHFRPISDIEGLDNNSILDVIGIVTSISPTSSIMRKKGTETQKRTLQLKDMSGRSVEITLWGNLCHAEGQRLQNMCDSGVFPVLAVKSGRINDFNGKAVGTISTSQLFVEPDFPEAHRLKDWFEKEGRNALSISISRERSGMGRTDTRKTISQIKDERLGTSEKPDWITVSATVSFIKVDNFCYMACPVMIGDRQCNKKVTNNGDGKWHCDRCDQSVDEGYYRYILQLQIQDHTGLTWVTAFQESGEEIMGVPAKNLYYLKYEEQDDDKFAESIRKVLFTKYIFKLKVKEETFSDEQRVKSTVVKAEKVNFSSESRYLLDLMDKLRVESSSSFASKPEIGNIGSKLPTPVVNPGGSSNAFREYGTSANQARQYGNQYSSSTTSQVGQYGNQYNSFTANQTGQYGNQYNNSTSNQAGQYGNQYSSSTANQAGQYGNQYNSTTTNQMGQYGNRYNNSRVPISGTSYSYCNSCGGTGHTSVNCPSIVNSQAQPGGGIYSNRVSGPGAAGECFKCHQTGHWARDCPGLSTVPPAYGASGYAAGR